MKKHLIFLVTIAVSAFILSSCEKKSPFDAQSPSDDPLILIPYESDQTGSFITVEVTSPDPYVDSVVVIPSAYTTVNWYLDKTLVYTGLKINQSFPTGTYDLLIEAVTTEGKRTSRSGKLTVLPAASDPYVTTRVLAPEVATSMEGRNLDQVEKIILSKDFYGKDVVCTIEPTNVTANKIDLILPDMKAGSYYINLYKGGTLYGSDKLTVQKDPAVLGGFISFLPGEQWVITGVNLKQITSITLGSTVVTDLIATATSVTLTAPSLPEGEYTMTMQNSDGATVLFSTLDGFVSEVKIRARAAGEFRLWEGPVALDWNADLVNIPGYKMTNVPISSTILVYFEIPAAEYHNMRITTPWWGDDLVAQFDVTSATPNPITFVYDDRCKGIVDKVGSWSIVGFGETIYEITYK